MVVNEILFEINEDVIAKVGGFSLEGTKWRNQTRVANEMSLDHFYELQKALCAIMVGLSEWSFQIPRSMYTMLL